MSLSSDLPQTSPDEQYAVDIATDRSVVINFELTSPDSAYVLGACRERGVSIETAVQEALVEWASR